MSVPPNPMTRAVRVHIKHANHKIKEEEKRTCTRNCYLIYAMMELIGRSHKAHDIAAGNLLPNPGIALVFRLGTTEATAAARQNKQLRTATGKAKAIN